MNTGNLTPRTNKTITSFRFTGAFGQPNGFGSVLEVHIREDGRLVLTNHWKDMHGVENLWSVELDNEQRKQLAQIADSYHPRMWEKFEEKI